MRVRAFNSIGAAQIIVDEPEKSKSMPPELARITIPDEFLADVTSTLLARCVQQNLYNSELREWVKWAEGH